MNDIFLLALRNTYLWIREMAWERAAGIGMLILHHEYRYVEIVQKGVTLRSHEYIVDVNIVVH